MCARNTPTIVVATPEQDITRKDYYDLVELLPDRDVGLVMGGTKKFSDDIQVITLQSMHLLDRESIGAIIVDEVHTASSTKRSEIILSARKAMKWGVSATPDGRFDGRDIVTEGLFGPVVYRRTYAQGIEDGALVPIKVFWLKAPPPDHVRNHLGSNALGMDKYAKFKTRSGKYRNGVDRNEERNLMIAQILKEIPDSRQVLCIMQHLDQMDKLMAHCEGTKNVHAATSQADLTHQNYHNLAAIPTKERRKIYDQMSEGEIRKVISTYVYKQGVNFPELSVVINAGGGGSDIVAKQIPGRESRNIDGKTESYLVDFWHEWDVSRDKNNRLRPGPIHKDDRSREKAYTQLGFDQVWLDDVSELPFLKKA
jgi:superfamily II DNA or RNA helicase